MLGIDDGLQGNVLRMAKVVDVHPEANAVDVVFIDNGSRMAGVQVLQPFASTDGGSFYLPKPTEADPEDKWSLKPTHDRDIFCVVAMVDQIPVVVGFLYQQVTHMAFSSDALPDAKIERHASDFEHIIMQDGSATWRHPGGSHITMGDVPALDGKDFDRVYQRRKNLRKGKSIAIETSNGTKIVVSIVSKTDGSLQGRATAGIALLAGGSITIQADGDINITANGNCNIRAKAINLN